MSNLKWGRFTINYWVSIASRCFRPSSSSLGAVCTWGSRSPLALWLMSSSFRPLLVLSECFFVVTPQALFRPGTNIHPDPIMSGQLYAHVHTCHSNASWRWPLIIRSHINYTPPTFVCLSNEKWHFISWGGFSFCGLWAFSVSLM